jgi:hypothetical protein
MEIATKVRAAIPVIVQQDNVNKISRFKIAPSTATIAPKILN